MQILEQMRDCVKSLSVFSCDSLHSRRIKGGSGEGQREFGEKKTGVGRGGTQAIVVTTSCLIIRANLLHP